MLGDCYGAAVVEALSKKELEAMDKEAEKERRKELEEDLERGHETIVKKCKQVTLRQPPTSRRCNTRERSRTRSNPAMASW